MAVRSNYIKNLMESKNSLEKQYQEVIAESMKNIIGDNAKEEVRKLLKESEDEDSFEEEDVDDDVVTVDNDEVEDDVDTIDDVEDSEDAVDDLWDDLENCKSADGEYDCRGMDDDKLIKVLGSMGPEDGIRVMSNGDGSVSVEVDGDKIEGTKEFVIDVDDFEEEGEVDGDDAADEDEIDNELEIELDESNTGYTDDYQKKTAMTTPDNHEPADPKTTYSMDAGVPKGTEKPWAQDGDTQPFDKDVNECVDECGGADMKIQEEADAEAEQEEPVNEVMSSTEDNPTVRGTGMTHANTNDKGEKTVPRSGSVGGERKKPTTKNSYDETNESIEFKKKMNKLYEENKQMKSIVPQLQQKLMESMVINQSMGYIVRLLNENTTSVDEKKQISERFSKVNTLEEGKKLYEAISQELKQVGKRSNVNCVINGQLAEGKQGKQSLVETTMYKSEKVNETLDFMKRLNAIK